jgi:hypothetical protein
MPTNKQMALIAEWDNMDSKIRLLNENTWAFGDHSMIGIPVIASKCKSLYERLFFRTQIVLYMPRNIENAPSGYWFKYRTFFHPSWDTVNEEILRLTRMVEDRHGAVVAVDVTSSVSMELLATPVAPAFYNEVGSRALSGSYYALGEC